MKRKIKNAAITIAVISLFLFIFEVWGLFHELFRHSILISFGIIVINFLLFSLSITFSYKKSNKTFLIFVLGGMVVRLFMVLLLVFLVLIYLKVDQYAFIFGLLIWYVFFLVYEIGIVKGTLIKAKE